MAAKPIFTTGWLYYNENDERYNSKPGSRGSKMDFKHSFCRQGVINVFDVPESASRVRFNAFSRPAASRVAMSIDRDTDCLRAYFTNYSSSYPSSAFIYFDEHRETKKAAALEGRTVYVECEYKE